MLPRTLLKTFEQLKPITNYRLLSTTTIVNLNQKWRQSKGLPMNPNKCGVLTDGPDYTYLDGRLTPYGVGQRNRIVKQEEIASDIIKLTAEIDFAVERHRKLELEEASRREQILKSKLKPKGVNLLKSK